jgi:molecular chaperone DnaK
LHDKARAEQLVADVRAALHNNAPGERLRALTSDLEQMIHMLGVATQRHAGPTTDGRHATASDDVVDVEFSEKP